MKRQDYSMQECILHEIQIHTTIGRSCRMLTLQPRDCYLSEVYLSEAEATLGERERELSRVQAKAA